MDTWHMKNEECEHDMELIDIIYERFCTIHRYRCSKCGEEDSISYGI